MRLLHTADWHLGRTTRNVSRTEDHDTVIKEIVDAARRFRPHLIIHSGDLFDGVRPSTAEMSRGVAALQELSAVAPVVVLSGNHDSPALFRLFNELIGQGGRIRFVPHALPPADGGILEFPGEGNEIVRLAPVPFVHHNRTIAQFDDPSTWMASYADQVGRIIDILGGGLTARGYDPEQHVLLLAAHLHVTGARFSHSERPIHVTDSFATRVERLPPVSYAAYGHIHRPQELLGAVTGRYSGSPLQLDFGEVGEEKSIVLVDAKPGRAAEITLERLSGGRPLRSLEGTLEEIRSAAAGVGRALCLVRVKTEKPVLDLAEQVAALLPEAVVLEVSEDCAATRATVLAGTDVDDSAEPSFTELFRDYLSATGTREASVDRVFGLFRKLIEAVEQEVPFDFEELKELEAAESPESESVEAS